MNVPHYDNRPVTGVLHDIVSNIQDILRSEVQLAKTEIKEESVKAVRAGRMLAVGGVLGLYALGFVLLAAVYALSLALGPWLAALIVGVVIGILALSMIGAGRARLKHVHPAPQKTIESVKENVEWVREQTK